MPTWTKMVGDRTSGGEKPLSVARGLEPLQAALPWACRLVRVFRPIMEIPGLTRFLPWQQLSLGGSGTLQVVSPDYARHVR